MSGYVEFRVSDKNSESVLQDVLSFYTKEVRAGKKRCDILFVVREDPQNKGDNVHYHGLLRSDHNLKYLRECRGREQGEKLKGQHIWKHSEVRDLQRYIQYMCKGEYAKKTRLSDNSIGYFLATKSPVHVVYQDKSFLSDEDIAKKHEDFWKLLGVEGTPDDDEAIEKKDSKAWFKYLLERVKAAGIERSKDGWSIGQVVIDCYSEHCKSEPNDFQLLCYIKSIQRQLLYDRYNGTDKEQVYKRFVQQRCMQIIGSTWIDSTNF